MSRRTWTNTAAAAGVVLALGAVPALAQQGSTGATTADEKARAATTSTGEKITDAWILTKVKTQFVGEDALKDSNINVDVRNHVVYLKGTVASQAGKVRAAEIARATDGVTSVQNHLRVGVAADHTTDHDTAAPGTAPVAGDVRDEGHAARRNAREAGQDMKDAAHDAKKDTKRAAHNAKDDAKDTASDVKHDAKETARNAGRDTRDATGTAGQAVTDGWITTKVKSSFVGVDALEGSDINVDTNAHVVTLRGTVPSEAARARAVSLTKQVDGVRSVKDDLTIAPKK